jgi:hypothetical protein
MTTSASIIQLSNHRKAPPGLTVGDWLAFYSLCFMAGVAFNVALWRTVWGR